MRWSNWLFVILRQFEILLSDFTQWQYCSWRFNWNWLPRSILIAFRNFPLFLQLSFERETFKMIWSRNLCSISLNFLRIRFLWPNFWNEEKYFILKIFLKFKILEKVLPIFFAANFEVIFWKILETEPKTAIYLFIAAFHKFIYYKLLFT